jgi:hypothetical protein
MVPVAAEETALPAVAEQPVLIGVLSFRPIDQTLQQWAPIAECLSRSIPGHAFRVPTGAGSRFVFTIGLQGTETAAPRKLPSSAAVV